MRASLLQVLGGGGCLLQGEEAMRLTAAGTGGEGGLPAAGGGGNVRLTAAGTGGGAAGEGD